MLPIRARITGGNILSRHTLHMMIFADACFRHVFHYANLPTLPAGVIAHWCLECSMYVAFGMMPEAESERTAFDLLFALYPTAPKLISYDAG